ncbi:MAG: glycosyltransferase family 2 protein [Bacteroidales bacterium]|nr:glycosyltransferase family 2 protein [Bacteroidales bacterium]
MKRVAVVILNYNGKKFLEEFLPTVIANTDAELADIVVADNASTDGSMEFMRERFPDIKLINNGSNGGFATGYNLALRQIEAEYFVLLNSDIEVAPHWIEPVVELMDADSQIAACQPKILSFYEKNKFEYAGASGGFIDRYGYPFCRGRVFQNLEEDKGQYDDICEVFWATGACLFVRADLYLKHGGLDDAFFAHMEEIDFCWRMKNLGYKIYCCPLSKVYHIGGGTLPKSSARKTYLNFRNNLSLLYKNLPRNRVFRVIAYRILLDWVAAVKFLCDGSLADFWAVTRAHFAFYKRIPAIRKEREKLNNHPVSMMYQRNIVFDNFLKGKKLFSDLDPEQFTHA